MLYDKKQTEQLGIAPVAVFFFGTLHAVSSLGFVTLRFLLTVYVLKKKTNLRR